jgi:hypothetical protein
MPFLKLVGSTEGICNKPIVNCSCIAEFLFDCNKIHTYNSDIHQKETHSNEWVFIIYKC